MHTHARRTPTHAQTHRRRCRRPMRAGAPSPYGGRLRCGGVSPAGHRPSMVRMVTVLFANCKHLCSFSCINRWRRVLPSSPCREAREKPFPSFPSRKRLGLGEAGTEARVSLARVEAPKAPLAGARPGGHGPRAHPQLNATVTCAGYAPAVPRLYAMVIYGGYAPVTRPLRQPLSAAAWGPRIPAGRPDSTWQPARRPRT